MVLDFERVKDVHLSEKNSTDLTPLPPDFYPLLQSLLEDMKRKASTSLDPQGLYAYQNLLHLAKEIVFIRSQKVVKMAIADAYRGSETLLENAVDWEKELYYTVKRYVSKAIAKLTGEDYLVRVRFLVDTPVIVGPDLKEYGPFRAGEEVPLPKEVAELLLRDGKVEVVE